MIKMCRSDLEDVGHDNLVNQMLRRRGLPEDIDTHPDSDEATPNPPSPSDRYDEYDSYFAQFTSGADPSQAGPSGTQVGTSQAGPS